jgi:hypothetical protein
VLSLTHASVPRGVSVLTVWRMGVVMTLPYVKVTIDWVCRVVRTDHHASIVLLNGLLLDLVMPILNDNDGPQKANPSRRVQGPIKVEWPPLHNPRFIYLCDASHSLLIENGITWDWWLWLIWRLVYQLMWWLRFLGTCRNVTFLVCYNDWYVMMYVISLTFMINDWDNIDAWWDGWGCYAYIGMWSSCWVI